MSDEPKRTHYLVLDLLELRAMARYCESRHSSEELLLAGRCCVTFSFKAIPNPEFRASDGALQLSAPIVYIGDGEYTKVPCDER